MANKFTDSIKKNPNVTRDPLGQKFDKELHDTNQEKRVQDVQNRMKENEEKYKEQSKLKEHVSKMKGTQKTPDASKQRLPTQER